MRPCPEIGKHDCTHFRAAARQTRWKQEAAGPDWPALQADAP